MTGVGGGGAVYQCHRLAPPSSAPGNGVKENSTLSTRRVSDNLSNTQLYFRNDYLIQIEYLSPPKTCMRARTAPAEIVCYFVVVEKRTFRPFLQSPSSPFSRQREKPGMTSRGRAEF